MREHDQRPPQPIRTPQDNIREVVRTDIRIHCDTEPLLKNTLKTFQITEKEFKRLFAKRIKKQDQTKKKKGFLSRSKSSSQVTETQQEITRPKYYIRALAAVHFNLIYNQAKAKDFLATLKQVTQEQRDIQEIEAKSPDLVQSYFNFDKQLPPQRALELLSQLEHETQRIEEELKEIRNNHSHKNQQLLGQFDDIKNNLDQELKDMGIILPQSEINEYAKLLGEFAP